MIFEECDLAGAVFFFSEEKALIREFNYSEFEALLDGYVPAMDLANRELNAVYVEFNSNYKIANTVFFLVRFTSDGFVEKGWSVPILSLSQEGVRGPDLGAGPISLVCRSHCREKNQSQFLWDPDFSHFHEFKALHEAVARNRMAIQFKGAAREATSTPAIAPAASVARPMESPSPRQTDKLSLQVKQLNEKNLALRQEYEQSIADCKQQYGDRVDRYHEMLEDQKLLLAEATSRNAQLQETVAGLEDKIKGLRDYYALKLERSEEVSTQNEIDEVKVVYEKKQEAAVESATSDLAELLKMREVEILYRHEQETKLHEEISELREKNQSLVSESGDQLLAKMLEKGISFISYQPGAGHLTIPVSEIAGFMQNPTAYVAEKCGVTQSHYTAWLEHYHVPVCHASDDNGNICGENINRVEIPSDFVMGESDCCHKHRPFAKPHLKLASQ